MAVNRNFAAIFDQLHLRYSNVASANAKVQAIFGFKPVVDNQPEEREGFTATWDGFAEFDDGIHNVYRYDEIPAEEIEVVVDPVEEG